jgi:hypothetical protein
VLSVLSDIAKACRKIKNEKNNIKNTVRFNILSCSPANFKSKTSIRYWNHSSDENPNPHFDTLTKNISFSHRQ